LGAELNLWVGDVDKMGWVMRRLVEDARAWSLLRTGTASARSLAGVARRPRRARGALASDRL